VTSMAGINLLNSRPIPKNETMTKKKITSKSGFALTELAVVVMIMVIPILAVGIILADSQKGWNRMYDNINSDVATESYTVKKAFDAVIRKASYEETPTPPDDSEVEVRYYASSDSISVDRYARFFVSSDDLIIEYGQLNPMETLNTQTVCRNVSSCIFKKTGRSIQMILTLNNGTQNRTVATSAVMHNK